LTTVFFRVAYEKFIVFLTFKKICIYKYIWIYR